MKKSKIVGESLSKEEMQEVRKRIDEAPDPRVKKIMEAMLLMTYEELEILKILMERARYGEDEE